MNNLPYLNGEWESCQFDVLGAMLLYALNLDNIIYHLFSFRESTQDYKIHMDMEIVKFA